MKGPIMTPLRLPAAFVSLALLSLLLSGCKASDVSSEPVHQTVSVRVSEVTGGESRDMPLR
ncbi:MAG: efflux RND transporter periplasmic adaptor subunit, partial [Marinobacter sp.]|nr:efflux RND transporter periplasmic adaptor subunit [Marinobacter sp.]